MKAPSVDLWALHVHTHTGTCICRLSTQHTYKIHIIFNLAGLWCGMHWTVLKKTFCELWGTLCPRSSLFQEVCPSLTVSTFSKCGVAIVPSSGPTNGSPVVTSLPIQLSTTVGWMFIF